MSCFSIKISNKKHYTIVRKVQNWCLSKYIFDPTFINLFMRLLWYIENKILFYFQRSKREEYPLILSCKIFYNGYSFVYTCIFFSSWPFSNAFWTSPIQYIYFYFCWNNVNFYINISKTLERVDNSTSLKTYFFLPWSVKGI